MNDNFEDFYAALSKQRPSPKVMGELLPVRSNTGNCIFYDAVNDTHESAQNWALHAAPYLEALDWFNAMYRHAPEAVTEQKYVQLPLLAKVIIERGFCILQHGMFPPLFFGDRYVLDLEVFASGFGFPVRKIPLPSSPIETVQRATTSQTFH